MLVYWFVRLAAMILLSVQCYALHWTSHNHFYKTSSMFRAAFFKLGSHRQNFGGPALPIIFPFIVFIFCGSRYSLHDKIYAEWPKFILHHFTFLLATNEWILWHI